MLTVYNKSSWVATCSHINNPNASQYRVFNISLAFWFVVGQLSDDNVSPGNSGIETGVHLDILNLSSICLQYAF